MISIKSSKDVDFFDLFYEDFNNFFIVNANCHVFYRDIYVFSNHLKDLVKGVFDKQKIKKFIFDCLRKDNLIWYFIKLFEMKKNLLRDATMKQWIIVLIKRFKKRNAIALQSLQLKRYIMTNARFDKTSRTYVQNIMRKFKATEFTSMYN